MAIDARELAAVLVAADDSELADVLRLRGVSPAVAWRDVFDMADALLEPLAVRSALAALPRASAHAIAVAVASDAAVAALFRAELRLRGLVDLTGVAYPSVIDIVRTLPDPGPGDIAAIDAVDSASAAERALTTVVSIAELLLLSYSHPVARIGTGAISASERRRVHEHGLTADPDDIATLVTLATQGGLLTVEEREWLVTPSAAAWLEASNSDRWCALRDAWLSVAPAGLLRDGHLTIATSWAEAFPWDPEWPAERDSWLHSATLLGLIDPLTAIPTPWAALTGGEEVLVSHLPHEVDRIFLQNDLSVIAPGPLAPALDLRLRVMAVRESQAQASTYRFTPSSVQNALSRGESEESMLAFLDELSLTGIPQPLRYLIHESAMRHGSLTVSEDPQSGRTRITVDSDALRDTLLVDQTLRPLGIVRDEGSLSTRVARDAVALALADAHYPVVAVGRGGEIEPLRPGRIAGSSPEPLVPDYSELITRLRSANKEDMAAAWLYRELEQAVRARATLAVTVALPDGDKRTLVLEAAGIGGGRLRGRDRAADVERTLPLSHIISVAPVD